MDNSQFSTLLTQHAEQIAEACRRTIPIQIGHLASDMFKDNFRRAGYQGNGFTPWAITRRQQSGGTDAGSQRTPLLSANNHLMSSIQYVPSDFSVVISNPVPYAAIHNEGGTIPMTPAMRAHWWKEYYAHGGHVKGSTTPEKPESKKYKALALTKHNIRIPKRQFMGDSPELQALISQRIKSTITDILNK